MKAPAYFTFAIVMILVICLLSFGQKPVAQATPVATETPKDLPTTAPVTTTVVKKKVRRTTYVTPVLSPEELAAGYQEFVRELKQRKIDSADFIKGNDPNQRLLNGDNLSTYYLNVQQKYNEFTKGISELIRKKRRATDARADKWAAVDVKFVTLVNSVRNPGDPGRTLCMKCLRSWYKVAQAYWTSVAVTDGAGVADYFLSEVTW